MAKSRFNDEAMQARMLKPSISGEHLYFEEAASRAIRHNSNLNLNLNSNSNSNSKLDLNAPLLSVRRRDFETSHGEQGNAPTLSRRRSSRPFFAWEQQSNNASSSNGNSNLPLPLLPPPGSRGRFSPVSVAKNANFPPPLPQRLSQQQQHADEVKSEATFSVTATCFVSVMSDCSSSSNNSDQDEAAADDDECRQLTATTDEAAARDMILMRRFLPAAKAMATATSSSSPMEFGRDMWRSSDEKSIIKMETTPARSRTKFQDLILLDHQDANHRQNDELQDNEDDEGGGNGNICGPSGSGICGLVPHMLTTFLHGTKRLGEHRVTTWKKLQPVQVPRIRHPLSDLVKADLSEDDDFEDDSNSRLHRELRYTPSRGNLVASSPMVTGNRGFLGMPRKGILNPVPDTSATTTVASTSMSTSLDFFVNDDVDSVSSVSLVSLKLDNKMPTRQQRSNNGSGASEKVFCLDTLNQAREDAKATTRTMTMAQHLSVKETTEPTKVVRRPQLGDLMVMDGPNAGIEESGSTFRTIEKSFMDDADTLRICWYRQEEQRTVVELPNPKGPTKSWLTRN